MMKLRVTEVEVKDSTKLKSMIATVEVLTRSALVCHQESGLPAPRAEHVIDTFSGYYARIVAEKSLCGLDLQARLGAHYCEYARKVFSDLLAGGSATTDAPCLLQRAIYDTLIELDEVQKRLLLASNAISSLILAFASTAIGLNGPEGGNALMDKVIRTMGRYGVRSLEKYLGDPTDGPLARLYKVLAWTFVNGNPEMKADAYLPNPDELVFEQTAECRQWRNARIVGCAEGIRWPVNFGFFEAAAQEIDPRISVALDSRQCGGDAICRFRFKLEASESLMPVRLETSLSDDVTRPVAIVTGSQGTLGRAIVRALMRDKYLVIGIDRLPDAGLDEGAGLYRHLLCDLENLATLENTVAPMLASAGRIEVLVNNAGIASSKRLLDLDADEWQRVHAVHLDASYLLTKLVVAKMKVTGGGSIVCVSSVDGVGKNNNIAYASAKAALMRFTEVVAMSYGKFDIRANSIVPGFVESEMLRTNYSTGTLNHLVDQIPMRRFCRDEEVASVVKFLAGPASSYVNGTHIRVDGGYLL